MKKLISIVLTICMLFSLITVTASAEISEDERLELLKEKDYTYIDINPNIDAFASATVVRDYAIFETAVDSTDFNKLHTENGYTYRTRIPSKTHDGLTEIDGTESYYYKGIGYFDIDGLRIYSTQNHAPMLYATESFKYSAEELKNLKLNYYKGIAKATTAKMVAAAPETYTSATFNFPNNSYMPEVEKIEADGSNYNVFLKDSNTGAKIKIGPVNDKEFVKNAVDYVMKGTHTVTLPEGTKGDSIAVAATTAHVNDGGTVSAFTGTMRYPTAALLPVEINYKGGEQEINYVVITANTGSNDMVGASIVHGPKNEGGVEIDYSKSENFSKLSYYTNSGLTLEDVTFPSNVSGGEMNFAVGLRASQHDYSRSFSNKISVGTFELKDKEISTIKFVNDQTPGDNAIEGIIGIDRDGGAVKNIRALVPVTIENGDPNEVYFMYAGRVTQQPAVFGATVVNKSLQEKIDLINEKLKLVDENTTDTECETINKEIEALKAESELIKYEDFNQEKYQIIKQKLEALAQIKIRAVEAAIEGLNETYTYSMKDNLLSVYEDYQFLLDNGIEESAVNEALRNKLKALYAQYEEADAIEKAVSGWGKYSHTMYDEVIKANESLAEMEDMVSQATAEAIKEYLRVADTAKVIDNRINALPDEYDKEMLEEILAIEAEVNEFVKNGGSEDAFAYVSKLKTLVDKASKDEIENRIEELPDAYTTKIKAQIEKLVADVKSFEDKGGELSNEAKEKFDRLLAQKSESPSYITTKLNYTRDVFEDAKLYAAQGYADAEQGKYIYPAGAWGLTVSAITGNTYAIDEDGFVSQLNINSQNAATINGIPYQFGPIRSDVHGKANKPNSINAADCGSVFEIPVDEAPYEELYLAAWAYTDNTSAVITYNYSDGTTSTEANVKFIKGGTSTPKVDEYTKILTSSSIQYWRAYSSTATNDQKYGYGYYGIHVISHRLTPDDEKVLKSVKIQVSDQNVNVFALTGKVSNSGIILGMLEDAVASLANENTDDEVRKLVSESEKYIEILDAKDVYYEPTYATTIQEYKEEYITVESVECYTDIDNRNITVTFSGAISGDSATKQNFVLKKDGKVVTDYNVEMISDRVVKITVKNSFDYDGVYTIEISENVINDEETVTLGTAESYEYDSLPAVDVDITYKDNKISIFVKNNLVEKLDNFVVMIGAFDKDNALVKLEPVSGALEAGAEFNQTIDFNTSAEKINCTVINTLDDAKLLFNPIAVK